jgi:hypothetical protein
MAGYQPAHRRLRRQAGVGRAAGRVRSLRRCGHIPAARQSRSQGPAGNQPVPSRCASISPGVGPSQYPQDEHCKYVTPWSHCRAPHWGQGCRVAWSTRNRWDVRADALFAVIGGRVLLLEGEGRRCASPAFDGVWCSDRPARGGRRCLGPHSVRQTLRCTRRMPAAVSGAISQAAAHARGEAGMSPRVGRRAWSPSCPPQCF